jgi:hypothetical protein
MAALLDCLDELKSRGWPSHQLELVRGAAMQIISGVYGVQELSDEP